MIAADDYCVVTDVLTKHRDQLMKMTQQNTQSDMFNIMDQIRLEQVAEIDKCLKMWRQHNV